MKKLSALALGASLAGGCQLDGLGDGRLSVGQDLDASITPTECFDNITDGRISLKDQEEGVVNSHENDATVSSGGRFDDVFRATREDLIKNFVFLAAIGNLDEESNTLDIASSVTGTVEEDFGNGTISAESATLYASADFGGVPSLANTEIDLVVTDPTCSKLYSDIFRYDVRDYGYEDYYVEEK